jgi:hypothetical protein
MDSKRDFVIFSEDCLEKEIKESNFAKKIKNYGRG